MSHFYALALAVVVDLVVGDPHWMPHPVRWMGCVISRLEGLLYRQGKSCKGKLLSGFVLVGTTLLIFGGGGWLLMSALSRLSAPLAFFAEVWLSAQLLAARQLQRESVPVFRALRSGDLPGARRAVSMIVGRDTAVLDESGIARAAVETVAENTSDGVIAPLLYLALGGVPLGLVYKAINTMDSMIGYRNERYLYFGRAAARLDDAANWFPARLSGLLMCLAAAIFPGMDGRNALRIYRRDRRCHKSPNSAHTEAACAGALHIRLAGDAFYFGELVRKPTIGDDDRPVSPGDILSANHLMYATELLACLILIGIPALLLNLMC